MPFPSLGTSSTLPDAEEDRAVLKASQIVLGPRQEALRETGHSPRQCSTQLGRVQNPARGKDAAREPAC